MSQTSRIPGIVAAIGTLALIMAYLAGFFNEKIPPGSVAPPAHVVAGDIIDVRMSEVPLIEQATGTVRAKFETAVSARIMARIESIEARAGDWVEQGTALVTLDSRDLGAREQQAQQSVVAASARLNQARSDHDRISALYEKHTVSKADLDRAIATLRASQAELARARRAQRGRVDRQLQHHHGAHLRADRRAFRRARRYRDPGRPIAAALRPGATPTRSGRARDACLATRGWRRTPRAD